MTFDLHSIVARISLDALCPSMQITATDDNKIDIQMHVLDSINQGDFIDLHQLYEVPAFNTERDLIEWIRAKVIDVMVHEVEEFFTFDGEVFKQPKHPLPGGL